MADAAARREARRRRILENSQSRLQFISGKSSADQLNALPVESSFATLIESAGPSQTAEKDISYKDSSQLSHSNGAIITEPVSFTSTNLLNEFSGNELLSGLTAPPIEVTPPSTWEKLALFKYDIILLSIVLQVLYCLSSVTADSFYFFLPVAIYTITKIVWLPPKQQSNIANVLLLLNGMSPGKVQFFSKLAQIIAAFSQDACVFLFITITMQALFSLVSEKT